MFLSRVDKSVTSQWKRTEAREESIAKRARMEDERTTLDQTKPQDLNTLNEGFSESEEEQDTEFVPSSFHESSKSDRNLKSFPRLSEICDRFGLSNAAGAAAATAVLEDVGLVTPDDQRLVIAPNKLRNERIKHRKLLQDNKNISNVSCLYFDGKKTGTLTQTKNFKTGRHHKKIEILDHCVVLSQPCNSCVRYWLGNSKIAICRHGISELGQRFNRCCRL